MALSNNGKFARFSSWKSGFDYPQGHQGEIKMVFYWRKTKPLKTERYTNPTTTSFGEKIKTFVQLGFISVIYISEKVLERMMKNEKG